MSVAQHRRSKVPLAGSYPAAVALALLGLCPFLVLSTASQMFRRQLVGDLHTSVFGLALAGGLADAGYAFGAVVAADLIQRFPGRSVFAAAESGFVVASLLALAAPDIVVFTVGRAVQGLTTGMLLVAALPPLVARHGAARLPLTAAFVDLGLFGMVTLGPLVGAVAATPHGWRVLFGIVAALGLTGLVFGRLAFERDNNNDPRRGFDRSGLPVALLATALPFLGASWLSRSGFSSPGFFLPLLIGLTALGTLLVRQYRKREALMPLRLIAHTLPVVGIGIAMVAGATVTAAIELSVLYMQRVVGEQALPTGFLLTTQVLGVLVAAWLFKRLIRSRWLPVLAFAGLAAAAVGAAVLLALRTSDVFTVLAVDGVLLGFAAGAGVSPGLFMAGLSVPSNRLGPTFAFVELVRAEAAFLIAPVLTAVALQFTPLGDGVRTTALVLLGLCVASGVALAVIMLLGGARPHAPNLDRWVAGDQPAFDSPPVAAAVRDS